LFLSIQPISKGWAPTTSEGVSQNPTLAS